MKVDRLLIVDDEPITLELLSVQLRNRFKVLTTTSGAEGLRILRNHEPFAAVISDLSMPEMDGVEFLRHVKKNSPQTVRLVMTAGSGFESVVQSINESEVFRFIPKPWDPDFTRLVIEKAIEKYHFDLAARNNVSQAIIGTIATLSKLRSKIDGRFSERAINLNAPILASGQRGETQPFGDEIDAIELSQPRGFF